MSDFIQGEVARLQVLITDAAGLPADPASVACKIKTPAGAIATRSYPTDIEKTAAGAYRVDVALSEKGRWQWRWETSSPAPGACQGSLTVTPSNI